MMHPLGSGRIRRVTADVLSLRALNRATLERQLLLRRSAMAPLAAVEHLVGMQAQLPLNPYLGLWSRLEAFDPESLGSLVLDRSVVRVPVMRSTIHLVTADDCLTLRALAQPVLERELERHREYAPKLRRRRRRRGHRLRRTAARAAAHARPAPGRPQDPLPRRTTRRRSPSSAAIG